VYRVFPSNFALFCIFTKNSISLKRDLRQYRRRYTIHTSRNLPDNGLCYLRTVRVTAAVFGWLYSMLLKHLLFAGPSRAGIKPYSSLTILQSFVFLLNSRSDLLCAFLQTFTAYKNFLIPKLQKNFAEFLKFP